MCQKHWPLTVILFVGCNLVIGVSDINWFLFLLWALGGEDIPWRPSISGLLLYSIFLYSSLLWRGGSPVLISSRNQANLICWMKKYFPTELLHSLLWLVCLQLLHHCHLQMAISVSLYFFKQQRNICFLFTLWWLSMFDIEELDDRYTSPLQLFKLKCQDREGEREREREREREILKPSIPRPTAAASCCCTSVSCLNFSKPFHSLLRKLYRKTGYR